MFLKLERPSWVSATTFDDVCDGRQLDNECDDDCPKRFDTVLLSGMPQN